jgi:hypothetical protein
MLVAENFFKRQQLKNELESLPGVKGTSMSATIPGKNYSNGSSSVKRYESSPKDGTQGFL